ncbi:pentatricopeptide repeat-containing protein At2g13600-like [Cryptomeria japonica]|uniref:pentatricopeptide repeat-containing protein At2g13600-like n=1 Tax=Cryptomeria japonica TaxID=3369 RepID=UPI0025AC9851|nr:pentatricopeptide repeat-containing protein At2g13600-like [Cryptomeria japonica]
MSSITHLNLRKLSAEGRLKEAIHILLTTKNLPEDISTYLHLLQACIAKKALVEGKQVHSYINNRGLVFAANTYLQNTLINMYGKCGSFVDACKVFDSMSQPNIFSWNMIISGYRKHGFSQQALTLLHQMQRTAVQADHFTFSTVIPICANLASLKHGLQVHGRIVRCGFQSNVIVMNTLIDMYAKCGSINQACELFDKMYQRDAISWNSMITGYVQNGVLDEAVQLFEEMPQRNVVSWTAIISGYAQNGIFDKALEMFKEMQLTGVKPNSATFVSILPACAKTGALAQGIEIHQKIFECGYMSDVVDVVVTALIYMYAKCGNVQKACRLFYKIPERDVTSWNALIVGYAQNGILDEALHIFKQMQLAGVKTDLSTFSTILPVCAKLGALERGMDIHQKIIKSGFLSNVIVVTSLIDMYAKCGSIVKAHEVFDKMHQRDVAAWNAMIVGHVLNGVFDKALDLFRQMYLAGLKLDSSTFSSILPACSKFGGLVQGMEIHRKIIDCGILSNVVVTALIDMYAKCGSIQKARLLFDKMHHRDVASWNAMIASYAMHGYSQDALKLFELMKQSETNPNHVTIVSVLFACSHTGLVDDGCKLFNCMNDSYFIMPTMDHYICMVDLLGRAGYLEESLRLIIKMPIKPDVVLWMCFLSNCRSHRNIGLGELVARHLLNLDTETDTPYVLMSNIYAEADRWVDVQEIRKLMKDREIKKTPGCSWIEVHKETRM